MLNKNLYLNNNFFNKDVSRKASRLGFGEGLLALGQENSQVVGLCADLTGSTKMNLFADAFPERFIQTGIMEQHMVACAAGMAAVGKIPFAASYGMFNSGRNWEQIRTTICYNNVPVNIVSTHTGVGVGPDGGSHQALEDIALMRVIPNMEVIVPCDYEEAKKATKAIAKNNKADYLRLIRENTAEITTEKTPFEIGKAQIFWESENPDIMIVAVGPMVEQALLAAKKLEKEGITVIVINSATIKPLDKKMLLTWERRVKAVVAAEVHQKIGGLGSALAELFTQNLPIIMEFVAVDDRFGQSGTGDELMKYYQLDDVAIIKACKKALKRTLL